MKKKYLSIVFSFLLLISCSQEQKDSAPEVIQKIETINYTFKGEKIEVSYIVDENNDELIPIKNRASKLLDKIYDKNPTLIQFYLNDNTNLLFSNEIDMSAYLESIGKPLNSNIKSKVNPYQDNNLRLYVDCCYDSRAQLMWHSNCLIHESPELRLKNFSNNQLWSTGFPSTGSPTSCTGSGRSISSMTNSSNPNDLLNSVLVRNVFARFYENTNYGGRTIVLDARSGLQKGFRKLRKVRHRGKWSNRISSIKLTN